MKKKQILVILAFIIFSGATLYRFLKIYDNPIERWDEETNISVLYSSRYSLPLLFLDNKPFFEKPPLWYWINSVMQKPSISSARTFSGICGIFIIFFTVYISWQWGGLLSAFITWIILLSTNHLFVKNAGNIFSSHTLLSADLDSLQMVFLLLSFYLLSFKKDRYLYLAAIASGLAILVKGPLGVVPFFSFALLVFSENKKLSSFYWSAIGLIILIILPWYIFMISLYGNEFLTNHIFYHITLRTIQAIEGHQNPHWYYLKLLLNPNVFPAGFILCFSLGWIFVNKKLLSKFHIRFTFVTMILLFIIPSFMNTRLAWYILPFYPFASLFLGYFSSKILIIFRASLNKSFLLPYQKSSR